MRVSNVHQSPQAPTGNVQLLGFADLHLAIEGFPFIRLNGTAIKLVHDQLHFDPKSEAGRGAKAGVQFPLWAPLTAEARAVLTKHLEACPEIQEMIALGLRAREAGAAPARVNPFGGK